MLQRMKELTIQGRNGSYNTSQRKTLTDEIFALRDEINLVAERTTFNGLSLLKTSLNSSVALTSAALGSIAASSQVITGLSLSAVTLTNANVGKYMVTVTASAMTISAVQSATGLTGVSQTISFADLATEEYGNKDSTTNTTTPTLAVAAGGTVNINFDRLGIKFTLGNSTAVNVTTFAAGGLTTGNTLEISSGTQQAVFQAGANTRDQFAVTGFKDIRLFDRNLLSEVSQDDYRFAARFQ